MAEKRILIDNEVLTYQGLFDLRALMRIVDKFFHDRRYDKLETKNFEEVYEEGKQVTVEMRPYRKVSDYAKIQIRIYMVASNLKEVEIEKDGVKQKILRGKAQFSFDAYLITDYEHKWDGMPTYYFLRSMFDKFLYKRHTDEWEKTAIKDCRGVQDEIKSFLNMFRH